MSSLSSEAALALAAVRNVSGAQAPGLRQQEQARLAKQAAYLANYSTRRLDFCCRHQKW